MLNDFYMGYDMAQFLTDRPTDFFDIMANPESGTLRSFGCSVTKDTDGENEYNSHVMKCQMMVKSLSLQRQL